MSKSLGRLDHPSFRLVAYRGDDHLAEVLVEGVNGRNVRVALYAWQVKKIADLAREIVARQKEHAANEAGFARELADYVGEPKTAGT